MTSLATTEAIFWTECECCATASLVDYDNLALVEEVIAKALEVSELAQIAKQEARMRELLLKQWLVRSSQAVIAATSKYRGGASLSSALNSVDRPMRKWKDDVEARFGASIAEVYRLGRVVAAKKASGVIKGSLDYTTANFTEALDENRVQKAKTPFVDPTFDLYDKSAIAALQDDQMVWIGRHYDENVRTTLRTEAAAAVKGGLGRKEAAKNLEATLTKNLSTINVPEGFRGSSAKYFEGLAANTATNARVRGQLRSFQDSGVTRYTIVNPNDKRTSPTCQHLSGKTFTVADAVNQVESEAGATVPEDIKSAHPWVSLGDLQKISPSAGPGSSSDSDKLARAGFALPPYHFRCRSTIDMAEGTRGFSPMTAAETRRAVANKPPPRKAPTPKTVKLKPTSTPKPKVARTLPATMPPPAASASRYTEGKFKFGEGGPAHIDAAMEKTFGKKLTEAEWLKLAGGETWPVEAQVKLQAAKNGVITLSVNHDGVAIIREYSRHWKTGLTVDHSFFKISDVAKRGKGIGKKVLQSQVAMYQELGVSGITLGSAWDGRAVWPKMGFQLRGGVGSIRAVQSNFADYLVKVAKLETAAANKIALSVSDIHEVALAKVGGKSVGKEFLLNDKFNEGGHALEVVFGKDELSSKRLLAYLEK